MSLQDNPAVEAETPSFSDQAEANRIAASREVKPQKSPTPESRAEAKRRKAIKSQPPLASNLDKAEIKSITAPPSADLVAKDEEAARIAYVKSVQKAAEAISAQFSDYNGLSIRVEEVQADYLRLKAAKVSFKSKFTGDAEFRANSRLVREFFAGNPRVNEYLLGADGVTQYRRATDYFLGEMNVSYEYVRKLGETVDAVGKLIGVAAKPKQPKQKKQAAEVDYTEAEKYGEVAEKQAAAETVNPTETVFAVTEEVPVIRTVDAAYDAIIAYSRSAAGKLTIYERSELQSRLSAFFAGDADSHSYTINVPPVEEVQQQEA